MKNIFFNYFFNDVKKKMLLIFDGENKLFLLKMNQLKMCKWIFSLYDGA